MYKSQEGRIGRLGFFLVVNTICLFILYKLASYFPKQWEWAHQKSNWLIPILDQTVEVTPALGICAGIGFVLFLFWGYLSFWHQGCCEFLIQFQDKTKNGYKTKQGRFVRWGMFFASTLLFLFGAYRLYYSFAWFGWEQVREAWLTFTIPLVEIGVTVSPALLISIVCGILYVVLFWYLYFQNERISDFLIETESEMRKVSWPTPKDVVKSCMAVVFTIILLGVYLFVVDIVLNGLFGKIFKA